MNWILHTQLYHCLFQSGMDTHLINESQQYILLRQYPSQVTVHIYDPNEHHISRTMKLR